MTREELIQQLKDNFEVCKAVMDQIAKDLDALEPEKEAVQAPLESTPKKVYTLPEVREVLAEKSRAGHTAEVKALLTKLGYQKLSDVPEDKYAELMKEAEGI